MVRRSRRLAQARCETAQRALALLEILEIILEPDSEWFSASVPAIHPEDLLETRQVNRVWREASDKHLFRKVSICGERWESDRSGIPIKRILEAHPQYYERIRFLDIQGFAEAEPDFVSRVRHCVNVTFLEVQRTSPEVLAKNNVVLPHLEILKMTTAGPSECVVEYLASLPMLSRLYILQGWRSDWRAFVKGLTALAKATGRRLDTFGIHLQEHAPAVLSEAHLSKLRTLFNHLPSIAHFDLQSYDDHSNIVSILPRSTGNSIIFRCPSVAQKSILQALATSTKFDHLPLPPRIKLDWCSLYDESLREPVDITLELVDGAIQGWEQRKQSVVPDHIRLEWYGCVNVHAADLPEA